MTSTTTIKVRLYNATASDQNTAVGDLPVDGKPHSVLSIFNPNNSKYPGKVVGNTVLIKDCKGAKVTLTSALAKFTTQLQDSQNPKPSRLKTDDRTLDDNENYDLSDWTITALLH